MATKAELHAARARAYLAAGNKPKADAHFRRAVALSALHRAARQKFGGPYGPDGPDGPHVPHGPRGLQGAVDAGEAGEAGEAVEAVRAVVLVNDPSNGEHGTMRLIAEEYAATKVDLGELSELIERALKTKLGRGAHTRTRHNMRLFFGLSPADREDREGAVRREGREGAVRREDAADREDGEDRADPEAREGREDPTGQEGAVDAPSLTGHPYGPLFLLFWRRDAMSADAAQRPPVMAEYERSYEEVTRAARARRMRESNMAERTVDLPCYYVPKEFSVYAGIHFALLARDVVHEMRANVADVKEVWLQLPTRGQSSLSPFFVVVNASGEYDYAFGETRPEGIDELVGPPTYATSARLLGGAEFGQYYDDEWRLVRGVEERPLRRARLVSERPLALTRLVLAVLSRHYRPERGRSRYEEGGKLRIPAIVQRAASEKLRLSISSVVSARDVARHWKSVAYAPGNGLMSSLKRHFDETSERADRSKVARGASGTSARFGALDSLEPGLCDNGASALDDGALASAVADLGARNERLSENVTELVTAIVDDWQEVNQLLCVLTDSYIDNDPEYVFHRFDGLLLLYRGPVAGPVRGPRGPSEAPQSVPPPAPVLAEHLLAFMQLNGCTAANPTGEWNWGRDGLNKRHMPAYLEPHEFEEAALRGEPGSMHSKFYDTYGVPPMRFGCPKLLSDDIVDEITRNVDDVAEIWLQFARDGAFLVVVNAAREYDYVFGTEQQRARFAAPSLATSLATSAEDPPSLATTLRYAYPRAVARRDEAGPLRGTHHIQRTYEPHLLRDFFASENLTKECTWHVVRRERCAACDERLRRPDARFYTLRRARLRAEAPLVVSTFALRALSMPVPRGSGREGREGRTGRTGRADKRVVRLEDVAGIELFGDVLHRPGGALYAATEREFARSAARAGAR
jgi:hypothetical protein